MGHLNHSMDLSAMGFPVWKTCMRTIVFFDESQLPQIKNNHDLDILSEAAVYRYLLEVICGLKSEIVGETQVLGQFKIFLTELEKNHKHFYLAHYALFQSLLQDCKELREKHIQNWGGSSYGSLTRKMTDGISHVSVLGNGQLAQSLLPWMKEKSVLVFGRNPKNPDERILSIDGLRPAHTSPTALVIAAPVENSFLLRVISKSEFTRIIDWRTEDSLTDAGSGYHSFKHLVDFMEAEKIKKQTHISNLNLVIEQKISNWTDRRQLRPSGWEDLC